MVNEIYYGIPESWHDRECTTPNSGFIPKTATFNNSTGNYTGLQGAFGVKWVNDSPRNIKTDNTFCYIEMDKYAPMHGICFKSAPIVSGDYTTCNKWKVNNNKNVPFGWTLWNSYAPSPGNFPEYWEFYGTGTSFPVNADGTFIPDTIPRTAIVNNIACYVNHGWFTQPVLYFPYKNVRLVPIVYVQHIAGNYTISDLEDATDYTTFNNMLTGGAWFDLKTYANGMTYQNGAEMPVSAWWSIVRRVAVVPCSMIFDSETGELTNSVPIDSANAIPSYTVNSTKSTLSPVWFYDEQTPEKVFYGNNAQNRAGDFSCIYDFAPVHRFVASAYKSYTVSGTTNVTLSQSLSGISGFTIQGECENRNLSNNYVYPAYIIGNNSPFILKEFETNNLVCTYVNVTNLSDFTEFIRKCCAYFGMFFTDGFTPDTTITNELKETGVYLGIVDEYGVTHGAYSEGLDNPGCINYDWENPTEDTPLNPGHEPDTEIPSNSLTLNTNAENGFNAAMTYYALRRTDLDDISNYIAWYLSYENAQSAAAAAGNPYEQEFSTKYPTPADWYAYIYTMAGYGIDPNNDIVSLMVFPFELTGTDSGYKLGTWLTNEYHNYFHLLPDTPILTGKLLTGDGFKIVNLGTGTVTFNALTGDFRDFAPYTRLELQIPYHGTVSLDTGEWLNKTINISAIVDIMTGASLCVVCRDSAPVITIPGQMGISVPITRDNISQTANTFNAMSASVQSGMVSAVAGVLTGVAHSAAGVVGAVSSGITGNLPGVVTGSFNTLATEWGTVADLIKSGISIKQEMYDMQHTVNGKLISGSAAPSVNVKYETKCRLVWHYPQTVPDSDPEKFGEVNGYACNITGRVSDFSGFVKFANVDLKGITATDTEKQAIANALQNGIFIN